jgi:hypothetical protein
MSSLPHMTARFDLQTVTNEARRLYKAGPWLGHGATLLAETEAHEEKIPGPDEFHDVRLRESAGKLFWEPDTVELGPWQPLTLAARIYPDPDAFQVQMRGAFGRKGLATVPLNRDGPVFRGNLAVAHVPLYYQFLVDGRPYPDPGPASHQVCCGAEGLTTPWTESGEKRYIRIHNESERLLRGTLTCPNNTVTVTPERLTLKPGEEALLSLAGGSGISPRRLKSTLVLALDDANVSPDSLDVTWQPDWPDPLVMPRDAAVSLPTQQIFGTICEVPLRLHVTGSGPVRIYVFCRENGWLHEATT